jgi:hypothetical protein
VTVAWVLTGGPCEGTYHAESSWPPPERIKAVHDGNGYTAVLDLPEDLPQLGETVVEYELASHGFACGRPKAGGPFAHYFPVGWAEQRRMRAARVAASGLTEVGRT